MRRGEGVRGHRLELWVMWCEVIAEVLAKTMVFVNYFKKIISVGEY